MFSWWWLEPWMSCMRYDAVGLERCGGCPSAARAAAPGRAPRRTSSTNANASGSASTSNVLRSRCSKLTFSSPRSAACARRERDRVVREVVPQEACWSESARRAGGARGPARSRDRAATRLRPGARSCRGRAGGCARGAPRGRSARSPRPSPRGTAGSARTARRRRRGSTRRCRPRRSRGS